VPSRAVFRSGAEWAAFKIENGIAHKTSVQLGHRGAFEFEVLSGLAPGDTVITHPSAEIKDGARVKPITPA